MRLLTTESPPEQCPEDRFAAVFAHLGLLVAYARRRGARDPEAIAAEAMTIAWRRLADVPREDPRPWLIATARNLMLADRRKRGAATVSLDDVDFELIAAPDVVGWELDAELVAGLRAISPSDREVLLLIAWEDLTPALAAASLGISGVAFRARLFRARRRLMAALAPEHSSVSPALRLEES